MSFRDLIAEDTRLKYHVELGVAGMVDHPFRATIAEKLELLQRIQNNFDFPEWKFDVSIQQSPRKAFPIIFDRILGIEFEGRQNGQDLEQDIVFTSVSSKPTKWSVTLQNYRGIFTLFADPSQDLLVQTWQVHRISSLSTLR